MRTAKILDRLSWCRDHGSSCGAQWNCWFYRVTVQYQGPELQCLLKVKEDLSLVLIFQDAKYNVSNWLLSDFINLTQVHNFTVSAQDIFTFRRLSVFTVSFTGILQLLMQVMKRFVPSYWLDKGLWYRVNNQKVVSSSPRVWVVFLPLFDSFNFIYYRCTTTSEESNFGTLYFKRFMRNA